MLLIVKDNGLFYMGKIKDLHNALKQLEASGASLLELIKKRFN